MAHHVYANGNEIATTSADGKSSAAAPDVCFTTPPSVAGGTPIPFTNTCKAKDIANGSRTVFIKGGAIALEDQSYFKTSVGDEGATEAHKKGIVSGKIKGKGYFISWSPNVKVEGLGVARHMDTVTHNHSNPPNTPPQKYLSVLNSNPDCKKDKKRIKKKCKSEEDRQKEAQEGKDAKAKRSLRGKSRKTKSSADSKGGKPTNWVDEQCGPVSVKPGLDGFEEWKEQFGDLDKKVDEAMELLQSEIITRLEIEVAEFAVKKAAAFAARRAATGWIPVIGWIASAVDLVVTGYEVATTLPQMMEELEGLKETVDRMSEESQNIKKIFSKHADDLKNFDSLTEKEQVKIASEVMADSQTAYANANPCLRARKCLMVDFKRTGNKKATRKGEACCPGQTGHHLMPDAMFRKLGQSSKIPRDKKETAECWSGYTEGASPTICLEGGSSRGSHGEFHDKTKKAIKKLRTKETIDYTTARNKTTKIAKNKYGCDQNCLNAQMDAYYKEAHDCGPLKGAKVVAHTGASWGAPTTTKPTDTGGGRKD